MHRKRFINGHVGARLAEIRHERGLSQGRLAKPIGVTTGAMQAYEHGRCCVASERILALANVLQCEPADLLTPARRRDVGRLSDRARLWWRVFRQSLAVCPPDQCSTAWVGLRRRALELLAASRDGCTEAIMLAHGFTVPLMVEFVRAGLASAQAERVRAGSKTIEVARVWITEAGRRALAKQ